MKLSSFFIFLLFSILAVYTMSGQAIEPSLMKTKCILIDDRAFNVEIAETEAQKQQGLQFRTALNPDGGMLFPYNQSYLLTFWMKDCKIPLDLLFFKDGILVDYVDSAPPCSLEEEKCPRYSTKYPSDMVIELKAGSRELFGFNRQSRLSFCSQ